MRRMLDKATTIRGFIILLVAYGVIFGSILYTLSELTAMTGGIGILDFDIGYNSDRVATVFGSYGAEGMALYHRIQLLDLLNPAIYSLIFASLLHLLWPNQNASWIITLPFLAGALDYAENLILFFLGRSYPDLPEMLVHTGSLLSILKNVALFASVAALLTGLAILTVSKLRRKN